MHFKEDIQKAKQRLEAWWENRETDRALIQVTAPREQPVFQIPAPEAENLHDFWTKPEVVIPRIINRMGSTYYGGEAFPILFPVQTSLVSIICKYLGAPNIYIDENTTWSEHIIHNWENCPSLEFDPENKWWRITENLLTSCVESIKQYNLESFIGLPDLNGSTEILSGLRNPEKLCMDMILNPELVMEGFRKVQKAWFKAWKGSSRIAQQFGGNFTWMGLWSEKPAIDLQSDFSTLISTEMFSEFIIPFLKEQIAFFPHTIFHLDGPGMVRHLDLLLDLPDLNAIQWVQGAGAGKTSQWLELLKKIQKRGKSLLISSEPGEVEYLLKNLDPKGLMISVQGCESEKKARELISASS